MQAWTFHGAPNRKGCPEVAKRKAPDLFAQVRGSETLDTNYSHSIVKTLSSLFQFVVVCPSSSYLHPVSKIAENPWGQIWVTVFQAILDILWGHAGSRQHKRSCLAHHAGESRLCCSAAVLKQDPLRIGVLPHVLCPLSEHGFVTGDVVEDFGPTGDDGLAAPLLAC